MNRTEDRLTRQDVERIVAAARADARAAGVRPNLRGLDLRGLDMRYADLRYADLRYADLRGADMRYADLRGARLSEANLYGAYLHGADLWDADLSEANLSFANLRGADMRGANRWGGLPIQAGASGEGYMVPTPDGWRVTIGCWWDKTLDDLRDLIEDRAEWPEARGEERERRRPMLRAVLTLCEAHIAQQPEDIITKLHERWGES